MRRVLLLYNTDYDDELIAASPADVSAVREAALAVYRALVDCGLEAEIAGVHGDDLGDILPSLSSSSHDLVFNLVESLRGDTRNEQVLPALLSLYEQRFTGPTSLALGLCLHKEQCKQILEGHQVDTPASMILDPGESLHRPALREALSQLEYPYFLKLAREDASIGITASNRVDCAEALVERARELFGSYGQPVLAERYIEGREVNVTLIGNGSELQVLPLHEIDFAKMPEGRPHIVSYAAKWDEEHAEYEGTQPVLMEDVSTELRSRIENTAKAAFRALRLRDFGRVDLRIDSHDRPWVIDVNPNCDLSPDAGVARAAKRAGMDYHQLIGRICDVAWRRYERSHSKS